MKKLATAATLAMLLGGCQSIFGHQAKLEVRSIGPESTASTAAVSLEEGRDYLRRGQIASAIVALQIAALEQETAAAAHNGLGVAYAMLGRGDVAERFFLQAVDEDPAEPKYAGNLARFYRSREAALAKVAVQPVAEVTAAIEPAATPMAVGTTRSIRAGPSFVQVDSPTRQQSLTRISRQEVTIRTSPERAVPAALDGRRRNPRFVAAHPPQPTQPYPLRIDLAKLAKR